MNENAKDAQHEKLRAFATAYVPEWRFSTENPDAGSVVAILIDQMLTQSRKRYGEVLHKHKIQYLNLFDRLKEEPIESAKSYVRFSPAAGVSSPVHIPQATRLIAEDEQSGQQMIFETSYGITAISSELAAICVTDRGSDRIVKLFSGNGSPEEHTFTAFDLSAENRAEHRLLLGFDRVFDHFDCDEIALTIQTLDPDAREPILEALCSPKIQFSFLEPEAEHRLPTPKLHNGALLFQTEGYQPQKVALEGQPRYILCLHAKELCSMELCGARLLLHKEAVLPDEVLCSGITQNPRHFLPFGSPMEIYAECGIECRAVFARPGALIQMDFDLAFEEVAQKLPETAPQIDYKVIMKKSVEAPKIEMVDVRADYALLEYYSKAGWKRLIPEENAAFLFNGTARGAVTLSFRCPDNMVNDPAMAGGYRVRLRLLRADHLYRVPCRIFSPIIDNLRFSYTYEAPGLAPNAAYTRNNFETENITPLWRRQRSVPLFYTREAQKTCMYFGFTQSPFGSPTSLYFEVENNEDLPLDFTVEYLSPSGFSPIQTVDYTGGLLYSGCMLLLVPSDAAASALFGERLYWLRLVCRDSMEERDALPVIHGVFTNMARVENQRTRTETFFIDDANSAVRLQLEENNLLSARVFVNEQGGGFEGAENWIPWEKRTCAAQQGRFYDLDLAAGTIRFEKGRFAAYPISEEGPMIRVDYHSYQGTKANVPAGAIATMEEPIKFISAVRNPMAAYGGYDGYSEESSAAIISNMLRTRGRAVSSRDYFDMIAQISYGVRQIKCRSGVNRRGEPAEDMITVALLIDEYEKGSHIFSAIKDSIREKLLETSSILPLGKTLILSQPHFIKFSVRIWLLSNAMESIYDLQKQTNADICKFLDPLTGGFGGEGWRIGVLPTVKQLMAYLKMKQPMISIERISMSARVGSQEFAVDDDIYAHIHNPFAMAINGGHTVYVEIV